MGQICRECGRKLSADVPPWSNGCKTPWCDYYNPNLKDPVIVKISRDRNGKQYIEREK